MKKNRLLLALAAWVLLMATSCSSYTIYSVRSRPNHRVSGGLVYALPHTQVRVAVTFDKYDFSSAPFADYAKDMLGVVPVNKDSIYAIRSIEISTQNTADPEEYYYVVPRHTAFEVDPRGLLLSVGVSTEKDASPVEENTTKNIVGGNQRKSKSTPEYNLYDRTDTFYTRYDAPGNPSMITTGKDVRSLKQRAQAAAEHIEDIREKKEALLFGEYEGTLSPESIQYIYGQLDKMEHYYLQQFLGTVQSETVVFYVDPRDEKTSVEDQTVELFRFSPSLGIADAKDSTAMAVMCNIRCENELRNAARFVKYRTRNAGSKDLRDRHSVKYRVPESAKVTVFCDQFSFEKSVKVAQLGYIANLPAGRVKAQFDPVTNELIRIQ